MKATEKSDVYSMGIVLMELMTGLMPTDHRFGGDIDMVRWVETRMGSSEDEVVDSSLKPLAVGEETAAIDLLDTALQCVRMAPAERPTARKVADLLTKVALKMQRMSNGKTIGD